MGASARTLDVNFRAVGVDAVRSGIRMVRTEAAAAGGETATLNETAVYGLGEVSRGITNLGMAGHVTSMSVRELSGGVMRLGSLLGPGAGLAGIAVMAGGLIMEVFQKLKSGMSDAEQQFNESIARMANAGQSGDLQKKFRELYFGTPYDEKGNLRGPSAVPNAFRGSLLDLRSRMQFMRDRLLPSGYLANDVANQPILKAMKDLQPELDAAEAQARKIQTAIDIIQNQPASMGILPVKITARRPLTSDEQAKNDADLQKLIDYANAYDRRLKLEKMGPQLTPGAGTYNPDATINVGKNGPRVAKIIKTAYDGFIDDAVKENERLKRELQSGLAQTIGSAISEGITQGFEAHSIGEGFKAAGRAILAGIGGILEQMGSVWIQYGVLMTSLGEALWNPFTSGPAAIAIGAALMALGATLGSIAHGSTRSGSAAVSSMPALVNTGFINSTSPATRGAAVTPRSPVVNNITLLGDDPASVRKLQEMLDRNAKLSAA